MAVVIAILPLGVTAQKVTLTAKKVTYTRKKPIADYKKTFEITYPKVKATTPTLSRKIEAALSYEKAFDFKLADEMGEIQWLESATYDAVFNYGRILSVNLNIEGIGAYPDGSTKTVVVDTSSGKKQTASMVFTNLYALAAMVRTEQQKEKQETLARIRKEEPDADEPELLFGDRSFEITDLDDFAVDGKGVTFHYDYGFPHVAKAYEPSGNFFFSWNQVKRFIKSGGLLAPMVH